MVLDRQLWNMSAKLAEFWPWRHRPCGSGDRHLDGIRRKLKDVVMRRRPLSIVVFWPHRYCAVQNNLAVD